MISSMESTIVPRRFFTTRVDWLGRWLGFVLALCPALAGRCADGYLVRFGPPPLRFSTQFNQNKGFTWPTPLMLKPSVTNHVEIGGNPGALTNTVSSKATQIDLSPEVRPSEAQAPDLPRDSGAFVYPNSSTASNLLLISPQMLAEYLKANADSNSSPITNGFGNVEIPFSPPTPRIAPSSEAIYRTQ
jgi:hypothetical protein